MVSLVVFLCACEWICRRQPPTSTQGENKGARCRNFVAPIFHLAWHKRVRFTCACREVLNQRTTEKFLCPSVRLSVCPSHRRQISVEGLLHLFAFFFDDMIDFEKVNKGSHVRFLCRGILWTVFEKEKLERRHRAWRIVS